MGIPDEESWFRTQYLPSGTARGWRRTGCLAMLIGVLVIVAVAGVFGLVTEESSDDTAGEVVRIYGDAIGVSADEWREIRAEALEWANVVCSTEPAEFFETWTDAVPGRDAAIEVAEVRCVDLVRSFAKDGVQP